MSTVKPSQNPAFDALSDRHKAFVVHYLRHFNGAKAARDAGYSESGASVEACRLLANANIAAAVSEQMDRIGITPDRISCAYAEIAFGQDLQDFEDYVHGAKLADLAARGANTALVKSVSSTMTKYGDSRKIELHDRLHALDSLAKVKSMMVARAEISGPGGAAIPVQIIQFGQQADDNSDSDSDDSGEPEAE